jgi:hypothetical protein
MTPEERKLAVQHIVDFIWFMSEKGMRGNLVVPFWDGCPGSIKTELFFDPLTAKRKLLALSKPLPDAGQGGVENANGEFSRGKS